MQFIPSRLLLAFFLAPALTFAAPDISAGEPGKRFQLPPGFEVRLFAAEPFVRNPCAMTWDDRGRVWVIEQGTAADTPVRGRPDRVSILEDSNADGRADKATVFADGISLGSGIALGNRSLYLVANSNLYFLEDIDGDDAAGTTTILRTVSGAEHGEAAFHSLAWGPDGWLYMTHDTTAPGKVMIRGNTNDTGVAIHGGLARYHPATDKFEVFADGPSYPRGLDWNESGDALVTARGKHPLFHIAPAGQYHREQGTWQNPYGYARDLPGGGLPAIAGWRDDLPDHLGIAVYDGDQWPAEWRGLVFLSDAKQGAINCARLTRVGSTYKVDEEATLPCWGGKQVSGKAESNSVGRRDFLVSNDSGFRPLEIKIGPDGAMWILNGVALRSADDDRAVASTDAGRGGGGIWRVVWIGEDPGKPVPTRPSRDMNLSSLTTEQLAALLEHQNIWHRRMAQRLLSARRDLRVGNGIHGSSPVHKLAESDKDIRFRLAALWALHAAKELEDDFLRAVEKDEEPLMRAWAARLTGERGFPFGAAMTRLARLAKDTNAAVRLAVAAAARQFVSGSLTVTTPLPFSLREVITGGVLSDLQKSPIVPGDPVLPFVYWMALEPIIAFDPQGALGFLENAKDSSLSEWPMNNYVLTRIMRRICDITDPAIRERNLNYAMKVLGGHAAETQLANAALDGLIAGFTEFRGTPPSLPLEPIFAKLTANPAIAEKAHRLATLMRR